MIEQNQKRLPGIGSLLRKRKKDEFGFYLNYKYYIASDVPTTPNIFSKNTNILFLLIFLIKKSV